MQRKTDFPSLPSLANASRHSSPQFTYVDGFSFILSMTFQKQVNGLVKRQSAYLAGSGQATDSCSNAVVYNLVNGQLFANSTAGGQQFSADAGVHYSNFTPSATPGSVTTTFSVDAQNNLLWSNTNFYNNQARFCVMPDNTLVAVFDDPVIAPASCNFVSLSLNRVSTCAAAIGVPVSGPSGPTGVCSLRPT